MGGVDEFGPNSKEAASASALARLNIYEVTSARQLTAVELYLRPIMESTRITIAVHESSSRKAMFKRIAVSQISVPTCAGYVVSDAIDVLMKPGHFYAIGYDPSQASGYHVVSETGSLPIDGSFGSLIGSKTATSVSLDELGWDKFGDREYYRQRLTSNPTVYTPPANDAGADAAAR